jgi:hypothetical protein
METSRVAQSQDVLESRCHRLAATDCTATGGAAGTIIRTVSAWVITCQVGGNHWRNLLNLSPDEAKRRTATMVRQFLTSSPSGAVFDTQQQYPDVRSASRLMTEG